MEFLFELDGSQSGKITFWRPTGKSWTSTSKAFCEWMVKSIGEWNISETLMKPTSLAPPVWEDLRSTVRFNSSGLPKALFFVLSQFIQSDGMLLSWVDSCYSKKCPITSGQDMEAQRLLNAVQAATKYAVESAPDLLGVPVPRSEVAEWVSNAVLTPTCAGLVSSWTRSSKTFAIQRLPSPNTQLFPITLIHSGLSVQETQTDAELSQRRVRDLERPLKSILHSACLQAVSMLCLPLRHASRSMLEALLTILEALLHKVVEGGLRCIAISVHPDLANNVVLPPLPIPCIISFSDEEMFTLPCKLSHSGIVHSGVVLFDSRPSTLLTGAHVECANDTLSNSHFVEVQESLDRAPLDHIADDSDDSVLAVANPLPSWVEVVRPLEPELIVLE